MIPKRPQQRTHSSQLCTAPQARVRTLKVRGRAALHAASGIRELACGAVPMHDLHDSRLAEGWGNLTCRLDAGVFIRVHTYKHGVLGYRVQIDCAAVRLGWLV